jgi:hypothetical protein
MDKIPPRANIVHHEYQVKFDTLFLQKYLNENKSKGFNNSTYLCTQQYRILKPACSRCTPILLDVVAKNYYSLPLLEILL